MSDEQHKARLKHAAEVLGWLAEGKKIQWHDAGVLWRDSEAPGDSVVEMILDCGWTYRTKPEPVAKELFVLRDPFGNPVIDLRHTGFVIGDKVRVTKIED